MDDSNEGIMETVRPNGKVMGDQNEMVMVERNLGPSKGSKFALFEKKLQCRTMNDVLLRQT